MDEGLAEELQTTMDKRHKRPSPARASAAVRPQSFDDLIRQVRERRAAACGSSPPAAWLATPRESENAMRVLLVLESRILADREARTTFSELAALFGQTPKAYGRHLGQVASRIDAACVAAGLPLLGAFRIRLSDGKPNLRALVAPDWAAHRQQLAAGEARHHWSADDFKRVRQALAGLPPKGASLIWQDIVQRQGAEALRRALAER